jgi:hypothetical protein
VYFIAQNREKGLGDEGATCKTGMYSRMWVHLNAIGNPNPEKNNLSIIRFTHHSGSKA